jgi:hypothetical protein
MVPSTMPGVKTPPKCPNSEIGAGHLKKLMKTKKGIHVIHASCVMQADFQAMLTCKRSKHKLVSVVRSWMPCQQGSELNFIEIL